ncbi:MAG: flap endonuclease-1 [Chloroflexi bacterium]|nr:flap endonuclease-1 [Chloroflexota bacterium]MCL5949311.1 flap endonuclease-1 [Candidatus Bathyarchaeota archaeon]
MGVNFRDLIPKTQVKLEDLGGKIIAIDAYNAIYQFLSIIRQPDGTPLKDSTGKITSHLSGLFYRTSNLVEMGIKPIYVFDGIPPTLKAAEIERRKQVKVEAVASYAKAAASGDTAKMRTFASMATSMKDYMQEDSRRLLDLLGLPWVQAPSEGEAQAAHMTKRGDADYCASQDYDSLLFGAPRLLRNVTISGRRKLPSKNVYIDIVPEVVELSKTLSECSLTYEQLVDVGILIGTDFNPDGIKGLGPKTALKLIKQHGTLENALPHIKNATFPVEPNCIRKIFLHPEVTDNYRLEWREPDEAGVVDFMSGKKEFGEERIKKSLDRMTAGTKKQKGKVSLEKWFG